MDMCASAKLNSKIILSHHPHTMCKGVCFHTCTATTKGQDFDYLFFTPGKAGWYLLFFILSSWAPGLLYSVGDTQEEKLETGAPYMLLGFHSSLLQRGLLQQLPPHPCSLIRIQRRLLCRWHLPPHLQAATGRVHLSLSERFQTD